MTLQIWLKNNVFVAGNYQPFNEQLQHHTLVWKLVSGDGSFLFYSPSAIAIHIEENSEMYCEYIENTSLFIVSFLHYIHFRLQRYLKPLLVQVTSINKIKFKFVNC